MDKIKEELDIYKTVASMTGDILYRYDIREDSMELILGRTDMSKYGSTINNYLKTLYRQRDGGHVQGIDADDLIQGLKTPEKGYFECKAHISNLIGTVKWYNIIGKTVFDDYNEPKYIIGKMTEIEEKNRFGYEADSDNGYYDRITGFFNDNGIEKKLDEKCAELSGAEAAFVKFKIEETKSDIEVHSNENTTISIAQCIKREFPYNAHMGRGRQNEFYVIYYGEDINDSFITRLEELKSNIVKSVEQSGGGVTVNCGVYVGPFNDGEAYDIKEKAHMSLIKAKYHNPGSVVTYSGELEKELNSSRRNLENVEFDHKLVESALEIMSESGNIEKAINLIFSEIGQKYNIDRIAVRELNHATKMVNTSYSWVNEKYPYLAGFIIDGVDADYDIFERICDYKEMLIVPDTRQMNDVQLHSKAMAMELKSFVCCMFSGKHHNGYVCFECFENRHEWCDTEIKTFKLISQLISSYLLNIREYEEMLSVNESYETHDALTGLYKYEAFKKEASKYIRYDKGNKLAVVYMGIKDFLSINLRFGYEVGDKVLKHYADTISNEEKFVMGCRVNADNVLALMNAFDKRGNRISAHTVNRINNELSAACEHICPGMDICINAGISLICDRNEPFDYYIDRAFEARGRAINSGLDGIVAD